MKLRMTLALVLALASLTTQAEVYKWVDEKGKTNYSNSPPPSAAGRARVVEDQISVVGMDPAVRAWAEQRFATRERQDSLDWQERQRVMYAQPASTGYDSGYSSDYYAPAYYGGYYGGYYTRRPYLNRPGTVFPPRVTHHSPRQAFHGRHTSRR